MVMTILIGRLHHVDAMTLYGFRNSGTSDNWCASRAVLPRVKSIAAGIRTTASANATLRTHVNVVRFVVYVVIAKPLCKVSTSHPKFDQGLACPLPSVRLDRWTAGPYGEVGKNPENTPLGCSAVALFLLCTASQSRIRNQRGFAVPSG